MKIFLLSLILGILTIFNVSADEKWFILLTGENSGVKVSVNLTSALDADFDLDDKNDPDGIFLQVIISSKSDISFNYMADSMVFAYQDEMIKADLIPSHNNVQYPDELLPGTYSYFYIMLHYKNPKEIVDIIKRADKVINDSNGEKALDAEKLILNNFEAKFKIGLINTIEIPLKVEIIKHEQ